MKKGKGSRSFGAVTEITKAVGERNLKSIRRIFNEILLDNKVPKNWMTSSLVSLYNMTGIMSSLYNVSSKMKKAFFASFKLYEDILGNRLKEVADINKMQCGFMPGTGKGIFDVVFTPRRGTEEYR